MILPHSRLVFWRAKAFEIARPRIFFIRAIACSTLKALHTRPSSQEIPFPGLPKRREDREPQTKTPLGPARECHGTRQENVDVLYIPDINRPRCATDEPRPWA